MMMCTTSARRSRGRITAPIAVLSLFLTGACSGGDDGSSSAGSEDGTDEDKGSLTLAFSNAVPQVEKVPTILAAEQLEDEGYDVELIWLQSSEDPVQAVVRGDADIGSANVSSVFGAAAQDAPIKAFVTQNQPSYAMVAPAGIEGPEGLEGMRVGIHAQVSSTTLYSNLLLEDYPGVEPEYVVVPGSQNRIQALIGGELDVSVIQLSDIDVLDSEAPGEFEVLYNYAEEMTDIVDSVVFSSETFMDASPDVIQDFLDALLEQQERVYDDPQVLVDGIVDNVPDVTEEQAQNFADLYLASHVWPVDGNFTPDTIDRTVEVTTEYGGLEAPPSAESCCTTEPLDEALEQ